MEIRKISEYLFYLFFITLPFYSVIRIHNIPAALILLVTLFLLLIIIVSYKGKIIFPFICFISSLLAFIYVFFGKYLYLPIGLKDTLPFIWGLFPLVLLNLASYEIIKKSMKLFFFSTYFLSFLVIIEFFKIYDFGFIRFHTHKNGLIRFLGISSSNVNPNPNSFGLRIVFVFLLSLIFYKKLNFKWKIFYAVGYLFLFLVILLSESRSIIFGLLISLFILILLYRKIKVNIKRLIVPFLLLIVSIIAISRMNSLALKRVFSSEFSKRTVRWKSALNLFMSSPVYGVGLENIKKRTAKKYGIKPKNSHNFYLDTLAGTGLLGFSVLLFFIFYMYLQLFLLKRKDKEMFLIFFIGFTTFLLFNMSHSMFFVNDFWVFIGFFEFVYYFDYNKKIKIIT